MLQSKINEFSIKLSAAVTEKITTKLPNEYVEQVPWHHLNGIPLADPNFGQPGEIDLLLGVAVYSQILQSGLRKGFTGTPVAQKTSLGWIVCGETNSTITHLYTSCSFATLACNGSDTILHDNIKRFWEIEENFPEIPQSYEDKCCENIFQNSVEICSDNRFSVKLPFINEKPFLGDSKSIALRRFHNLEKRLEKDPDLKDSYHATFRNYLEKDHMA